MSWERDPLFSKSKLFFQNAFDCEREEPEFGLWCALGLELLARAALASVSPTLLAEPDDDHRHLLHALNKGDSRSARKSIGAARVFSLCRTLFGSFREEDKIACIALINRRNDELHTGGAAFQEYPTTVWLAGFYRACNALATALGETLESVLGKDEAVIAVQALSGDQNDAKQRVASTIAAYKKVFDEKGQDERSTLQRVATEQGEKLARQRNHRTQCPSCGSIALLQGETFGKEQVLPREREVIVKQSVAPTSFACSACGLKLSGFSELAAAGLSGHYTRTTSFSPEEYYGLVDLDTLDIGLLATQWLREQGSEYDNG